MLDGVELETWSFIVELIHRYYILKINALNTCKWLIIKILYVYDALI